jgi:hypothetical protein
MRKRQQQRLREKVDHDYDGYSGRLRARAKMHERTKKRVKKSRK